MRTAPSFKTQAVRPTSSFEPGEGGRGRCMEEQDDAVVGGLEPTLPSLHLKLREGGALVQGETR